MCEEKETDTENETEIEAKIEADNNYVLYIVSPFHVMSYMQSNPPSYTKHSSLNLFISGVIV